MINLRSSADLPHLRILFRIGPTRPRLDRVATSVGPVPSPDRAVIIYQFDEICTVVALCRPQTLVATPSMYPNVTLGLPPSVCAFVYVDPFLLQYIQLLGLYFLSTRQQHLVPSRNSEKYRRKRVSQQRHRDPSQKQQTR